MDKFISQPFGLGDVIFSMTAIRKLNEKIIWGVLPEYVDGCNAAYPDITFVDWKTCPCDFNRRDRHFLNSQLEYIPLRWQDNPLTECMKNKYAYFGLDYKIWKDNASYKRNEEKELQLFKELGLSKGEKYNLVNNTFGCTNDGKVAKPGQHKINSMWWENEGGKNINFEIKEDYSMFDWSYVIENANYIYTVSTSSLYLFELLDLKAKEIHLFLRKPFEKNHDNYSYLLTTSKNYILHE